jgi:hypothetical protein
MTVWIAARCDIEHGGAVPPGERGCQPNMKSRAYRDGGVLVPTEQEIIGRWYYRWYREAMGLLGGHGRCSPSHDLGCDF